MTNDTGVRVRLRWSPPSRLLSALLVPILLFALVDGPRLVEAAELSIREAQAERVRRGQRSRGAGARLARVLEQLERASQPRRGASPLAGRQRELLAARASGLIDQAGDELFARGEQLRVLGVPDKALRRHQALVDQFESKAAVMNQRLATGSALVDDRAGRTPLTIPWQAVSEQSVGKPEQLQPNAADQQPQRSANCTEPELCDTPEVVLSDDIHALASQLGRSPAQIADWVRRNITFEPYPGALKTSDQVVRTRSGNATDIASLLLALLRSSDVHSRYASGTVALAGADAAAWLGVDDAATAVRLLNAAGLDAQVTPGAGGVQQVAFAHAWVEAYVGYAPTLGAASGPGGSTGMQWIGIDAAVKRYQTTSGRDLLSDIAADPDGLLAEVRDDPSTVVDSSPPAVHGLPEDDVLVPRLDQWGGAMRAHLEHNAIDLTTAFGARTLTTRKRSTLSAGLPFAATGAVVRATELADGDRVHVALRLRDLSGTTLLSSDVTATDAYGKRWTLLWQPATIDDQQTLDAVATLDPLPTYLIDVKPVVTIEGQAPAEGNALAYGWPTELEVTVSGPGLSAQTTVHEIRSGTAMAFVVAGGSLGDEGLYGRLGELATATADPLALALEATIGEALNGVVASYLHEEEHLQSLVEGATATHLSRRLTVLHAAYEPDVTELLGIPWESTPGSIALVLDRRVADTASAHGELDAERTSRIATGLVSGALGHQALEQIYGGQAGSGARVLQAANESSPSPPNRVVTIDGGNCANTSSLLLLSAEDESAVADLCAAGLRVTVAESAVTLTGGQVVAGFVAVDPATGRAHTGLLPAGGLGRIKIGSATFPTIADTLRVGLDADRYRALVAPVETWVRRAKAATEDVGYAFVPGAASLRRWLDHDGDSDPVTFLTAVLAVAGTFEALTARPKVMALTASPRVARPEQQIEIVGESIYADDWHIDVVRASDDMVVHPDDGTGDSIASTWSTTGVSDGIYRIEATATTSEQTSPVVTTTIQIDGTEPTVAVTSPTVIAVGDPFEPIIGTVQDANLDYYTVEIRQGQDEYRELRRASHEVVDGALAMFVARDEQTGEWDLRVTAVDHAGNLKQVETTFYVDGAPRDLDAPVVNVSVPPGAQQGRVEVTVTATDDSAIDGAELWLDGERIAQQSSPTTWPWPVEINGWSLANGAHELIARATDEHGREGASDATMLTTDNYISELRVEPAAFDQLNVQPVLTAKLGGPTAWTSEVLGVTPQVASSGDGQQLTVYWRIDASTVADGDYVVEVTSDSQTGQADVSLISQNQEPVVTLETPSDGGVVRGLTDIIGSIEDDPADLTWWVEYQKEGAGPTEWIVLAQQTGPRTSALLAQLDPSLLRNGLYKVRLRAHEPGLAEDVVVEHRVRIDGEMKVGHFTISMQDVAVNVGGIPVSVVRTYDSRDREGGEFGPGWRLELRAADLEIGSGLDVAMTLPDGRRTTFGFFPKRLANGMYQAEYHSITGVHDTLRPVGSIDLIELLPGVFTDWDGNEYNPQSFVLTTVDGTVFTYGGGKLKRVDDRSGNWVDFGEPDADPIVVTSSMGGSLTLPLINGKVDRVEEPSQENIQYDYDAHGRLSTVTDRNLQVTTFHYASDDPQHLAWGFIDKIDAPGGVSLIQNHYDGSGRLEKHVDADGNEILYDHDINGRQEVVTDREGHPTVYVYEDRGLVTAVTDPQGRTTQYEYDSDGNQTAVVDPQLNRTEYEYDSQGRVMLVRDALLRETETTYDAFGNVLTSTDALDRVTTNTYDDAGRLLTTTNTLNEVVTTNTYTTSGQLETTANELGHTTTFEYDTMGRRTKTIYHDDSLTLTAYDNRGNVQWDSIRMTATEESTLWVTERARVATQYFYDDGGRLVRSESPLGCDGAEVDCTGVVPIATTTTYTPLGQVEETTDGEGHVSKNIYDQQGRLLEVQHRHRDADPQLPGSWKTMSSFTYDANGQRLTETDEAGRITRSLYDTVGRLLRTTYPDQTFTSTAYDAAGRVTSTTDRNSHLTRFEYDELGRQVAVIDALNRRTESEYDEVGNLKLTRDPASRETRYFYDALNRRIRTEYADGTDTRTQYGTWPVDDPPLGRLQREIDQLGRKTEFRYDFAGRLLSVHQWTDADDPNSEIITTYAYDERGNRTAQVDALQRATTFVYDALDRLRIKKYPQVGAEPNAEYYAYDANGNLVGKLLPSGDDLVMVYDERNRPTAKSSTTDTSYEPFTVTYTASGQRESVTRGATDTWGWAYEPLTGRLASFTDPSSLTLTYGYDANGNRTSLTTSTGTTTFDYDALNRLTHVNDRNGQTTTYTYDTQKGVLNQVDNANTTTTLYVYDELDRVESIQHLDGVTMLAQFDYTLKANGRRDEITESIAGVASTVSYGYDDLDRLVSESRTGANPYGIGFDYDAVGNRRKQTRDGVDIHYAYDKRDRLQCESAAHDPDCLAPTTSYQWDENGRLLAKGTESYQWDVEDRMLSHNGATTFAYDIDGIRYRKSTGATTTEFLVDANRTYQEVLEEWTDGQLGNEYVHGMGLLWQEDHATTTQSFFHGDAQMSTRLLTDDSGAVQSPFTYEAFGTDVGLTGTAATPYRYTGQQWDDATGLYYLRARYMDARSGHLWTMDSVAGRDAVPASLQRYLYSLNSPVDRVDPSGRESLVGTLTTFSIAATLTRMAIGSVLGAGDALLRGYSVGSGMALGAASGAVAPLIPLWIAIPFALYGVGEALYSGNYASALYRAATLGFGRVMQTRGFPSFPAFKKFWGSAGKGRAWHHIVEQTAANVAKFGPEKIHNPSAMVPLSHGSGTVHARISGFYSSKQPAITGSPTLTIRQWLASKSFPEQFRFGLEAMARFGGGSSAVNVSSIASSWTWPATLASFVESTGFGQDDGE